MIYYPQIPQHEQQLAGPPYLQQIQPQRYLPEYDVITKPYYTAAGEEGHGAEANHNPRQKAYHFAETIHPEQYPHVASQFNPLANAATQPSGGGISSGALSTSGSTAPTVGYDAAWPSTVNKQSKHNLNNRDTENQTTTTTTTTTKS